MHPLRLFVLLALLLSSFTTTSQAWTPNPQEIDIANRMAGASGQHRAFLRFDPILAQVARERAMDLAKRRYFSHTNPDGHGANYLVRKAGYVLPDWYPADGNNLESIAAGGATSAVTWSDWMGSPDHKTHLLGEEDFFAEQTSYGVGYYEEASAPYRYYWVVLTAPPMPRANTLAIVSPAENVEVPEGAVGVSGTADGTVLPASVQISGDGFTWRTVAGTQTWSATVSALAPGANTLRARSLDAGGNVLAESVRHFQYIVVRPITVRVVGQGSVPHFAGTTVRRVGVDYSMTAVPAEGWLFTGWSGSWSGAQATVNVAMREGLEATATFVENPFLTQRGMYSGLIGESSASHDLRGVLRLQVNVFGNVTGQLLYAGKGYALLGQFRLNGRANLWLPREGVAPLLLVLDLHAAENSVAGTLIDGSTTNSFSVGRARQPGASLAALAGRYTVAFPAARSGGDPAAPKGDGYGAVVVDASGAATLTATLADGTAVSRGGWIAQDGRFAFYTALYGGAGELSGELNFVAATRSDLAGSLVWKKPATPGTAWFPQSFDATLAVTGARYTPPAPGQRALSVSSANPNTRLLFGAGNLSGEITQPALLTGTGALSFPSIAVRGITAAVDARSGIFAGTFSHPVSGAATRFRGVILQKANAGAGFFLGTNQSGYAAFTAAP